MLDLAYGHEDREAGNEERYPAHDHSEKSYTDPGGHVEASLSSWRRLKSSIARSVFPAAMLF
jgi:hypothetical protein